MADGNFKRRIHGEYAVEDEQFLRSVGSLIAPPPVCGNRVVGFENGAEIFPAMLDALRRAERTITFEIYIYWSGKIGSEFTDVLSERSRGGVRVHLLLDWLGTNKMEADLEERMRRAGVEIERVHRPRWFDLSRLNHRTHRKLCVVDGRVGFTGGVGIADIWLGDADSPEHWRDSHFRLEGPAVAQMQSAFMENWLATREEVLHGEEYFPALAEVGEDVVQVFNGSPAHDNHNVQLMYLMSIAASRRTIDLASAYFVPDDVSVEALVDAARRGVRIRILVPGPRIDLDVVRRASRARWGPLLEASIEIFEYQPTMFHRKILIADGAWVSVGSTNFDNRSFSLNDESNMNVLSRDLARRQTEVFEADLVQSRRTTLSSWRGRPASEKFRERMASLIGSQL